MFVDFLNLKISLRRFCYLCTWSLGVELASSFRAVIAHRRDCQLHPRGGSGWPDSHRYLLSCETVALFFILSYTPKGVRWPGWFIQTPIRLCEPRRGPWRRPPHGW